MTARWRLFLAGYTGTDFLEFALLACVVVLVLTAAVGSLVSVTSNLLTTIVSSLQRAVQSGQP